jgi:transposase
VARRSFLYAPQPEIRDGGSVRTEDRPEVAIADRPLLAARKTIEQQIAGLDRKVMKLARSDSQVRTFMTAPGIGPITALLFKATLDDPMRFARSRNVGAYLGLTPRRHASGEIDWTGRISKCGDALLRCYLFEAACVLLTRVPKWSALKAWGMWLAKRNGLSKANVAVAASPSGWSAGTSSPRISSPGPSGDEHRPPHNKPT